MVEVDSIVDDILHDPLSVREVVCRRLVQAS